MAVQRLAPVSVRFARYAVVISIKLLTVPWITFCDWGYARRAGRVTIGIVRFSTSIRCGC